MTNTAHGAEDETEAVIIVHRDLGSGFTHFDSKDCGCRPHIFLASDGRSMDQIMAEIELSEKRGDA